MFFAVGAFVMSVVVHRTRLEYIGFVALALSDCGVDMIRCRVKSDG